MEDKQKQSQYYKVQCSLQTLCETMKFVLEINLRCNPSKGTRNQFEDIVYGAFWAWFAYCGLGFKRQCTCGQSHSHTRLVCSKLPVMRHVNGGLGFSLHLNASGLGSVCYLVTVLLCDLGQIKPCEREAAFLLSCLDGKHHRAGIVPYCVLP